MPESTGSLKYESTSTKSNKTFPQEADIKVLFQIETENSALHVIKC